MLAHILFETGKYSLAIAILFWLCAGVNLIFWEPGIVYDVGMKGFMTCLLLVALCFVIGLLTDSFRI